MNEIYFNNISVSKGKIEIHCKSYDEFLNLDDILYFEFSDDFLVCDNQIAVALSTLCGQSYDLIYMDVAISQNIFYDIKKYTNAVFKTRDIINEIYFPDLSDDMILCFSGGFDSLATYNLLENKFDDYHVVSLDFGGKFSRESEFFKRFSPHIVKTNFVDLKLNKNSTAFMYIPIIFYSEYLSAGYGILADVLESENNLFNRKDHIPLTFLGITNIPLTLGLTEIGTALLLMNSSPDLMGLSLKSLANPGEEKRCRKQLILKILKDKNDVDVFFNEVHYTNSLYWGNQIFSDFLSLYFIKWAGLKKTSKMINNIPEEAVTLANNLSLDFYEKYNMDCLHVIPNKFKKKLLNGLSDFGILPYTSEDLDEFNQVVNLLSKYHPINYNPKFLEFNANLNIFQYLDEGSLTDMTIICNYENLDKVTFPLNKRFELVVYYKYVKYEFLVDLKNNSNNLIVCGPGAIGDKLKFDCTKPLYNGHLGVFEDSTIFYNDPTRYLNLELCGGGGLGTPNDWYLRTIANIVQSIANFINIKNNEIIFYGSGMGGFTSFMLSIMVKNSISICEIPQLNLLNHYWDKLKKYCFNNMSDEKIIEDYGYRIDVIKFMQKENYVPNAYLILDCSFIPDLVLQYNDFFIKLNDLPTNNPNNHIKIRIDLKNSNHNLLSERELMDIINNVKWINNIVLIEGNVVHHPVTKICSEDLRFSKEKDVNTYFKVKLVDNNGVGIKNKSLNFTIGFQNGQLASYFKTTDDEGNASLLIGLNQGIYKIMVSYTGDNYFKPSKSEVRNIIVDK